MYAIKKILKIQKYKNKKEIFKYNYFFEYKHLLFRFFIFVLGVQNKRVAG